MSASDDHRWPVRVTNAATGAVRTWVRMPWFIHFAWVMCVAFYSLIGFLVDPDLVLFTAWEVMFGFAWAAVWAWAYRVYSSF